jgi:hypothetical protein
VSISGASFFAMMRQPFGQNNYLQKALEIAQARQDNMSVSNVDIGQLNNDIDQRKEQEKIDDHGER